MRDDKENVIVDKSFQFALEVVLYCEVLEENRKFVISRQLLRSGTSIGANVREAQNAESKADFIHKLKLAAKEADETNYWLILCNKSTTYPHNILLQPKLKELQKLLTAIISTTKKNSK